MAITSSTRFRLLRHRAESTFRIIVDGRRAPRTDDRSGRAIHVHPLDDLLATAPAARLR